MPAIIDITLPIGDNLLVWPSHISPRVRPTSRRARGDLSNTSEIRVGSHSGTHVDAPSHIFDDGTAVEQLPLDALIGPAAVLDLTAVTNVIQPHDLDAANLRAGTERVLFKTRNSMLWSMPSPRFPTHYIALSAGGAAWLVDRGIRLVGTDFLSIERYGMADMPAHKTLLQAHVVIVEGLDLRGVTAGEYELVCLPLRITGADGAPARAVLLRK